MSTVLITGAAGVVGGILRRRLARPGRTLRLLDLAALEAGPGEETIVGSVTDLAAVEQACAGVDAVIHLGGISSEAPWAKILDVNINGTYNVFEGARRAGVPRVVFASSNHAVGFHTPADYPLPEDAQIAPDTYYGVAKAAGEALGSLYHDRYGLDVISVRILTCFPELPSPRALSTWLSPDDAGRLFEACLTAPSPGYRIVYGVSANTRGGEAWVSLAAARELGYLPQDDAEVHAEDVLARFGPTPPDDPQFAHLGGQFCFSDFDADKLGGQ
ncbi:MAG TPA: NAD(P)-dependent oxidoreductase [Actinocrinis sp.]|nr:NAD(P)-dependent oxidoreductase [Actinocrinis sp.]